MPENKKETISVIIPAHNGQDYMEGCVDSVLSQQSDDYELEVIIINDGSTDKSTAICESLRTQHDNIRIITMADEGVSAARNAGLDTASGDYISFVDADDRLLAGALSLLYRIINESDGDIAGVAFEKWHHADEFTHLNEKALSALSGPPADTVTYNGNAFIAKGILAGDTRCWAKLYRRKLLDKVRFMEGLSIGEDMLFLLAAAKNAKKIISIETKAYAYYQNPGGTIMRPFTPAYMDQIKCWQIARDEIGKVRPDLDYLVAAKLIQAIMLTAGKIALLPAAERKQYNEHIKLCSTYLAAAMQTAGALPVLERGYRVKVRVFDRFPRLYVGLYHLWKSIPRRNRSRKTYSGSSGPAMVIAAPCDHPPSIILYMHAGSGNHGCEAIVNSVAHMLNRPAALLSVNATEDRTYSLQELEAAGRLEIWQERHFKRYRPVHILYYVYRKLTKDAEAFIRYRYYQVFKGKMPPLFISIGGDNYCYDIMVNDLVLMNVAFNARGAKTVLLGCSIEAGLLDEPRIVADMLRYHTIIARESLSFAALKKIGHPRVLLMPDPAFGLKRTDRPLPAGFIPGNTVGINLSPLVQSSEGEAGITMACFTALIRHIIQQTDMQIALIPHVVWQRNDDRILLQKLYEAFADSGRIVMLADAPAEELKGYIARCRFFIGARTHAMIAAYSSCVPTIALGYSVKARGIALDLFGTDTGHVVPVQSLKAEGDMICAFDWLIAHEADIRLGLSAVMPAYIRRTEEIGVEIEKILNEPH